MCKYMKYRRAYAHTTHIYTYSTQTLIHLFSAIFKNKSNFVRDSSFIVKVFMCNAQVNTHNRRQKKKQVHMPIFHCMSHINFFSLAICCMVFVVVVHRCNLKVHSARTLITYSLAPNNANICLLNEYECCCLVRFFFSVYKCRVKCGHKFRLFVKGKCKIRKTRHENKCIEN